MSLAIQVLSTSLLVAVPASAFIVVTRPMAILERRLHMVGTVLCGWKGVRGLSGKSAFPVDDRDLFPNGSSKLNGVKFYGSRNPDEVVSYAASLMGVAGGGLVPLFENLRKNRNCVEYPVMNFRNYGDGGIGGEVQGQPVLLGNHQFLLDMGVEIPEGTMVNQAVYAAVDCELCAVYAISYAKMRSSSAGLVSLCSSRKLSPILVGRDFMITEDLIRNKFGVNTRNMVFPPQELRSALAQIQATPEDSALALATRDDLVGITYAVSGAKSLRTATNLGVALNIFGGILGMAIMLLLAYLGNTELLTPVNILLYQLVWIAPSLLITEWTRVV
jgi:Cu+-exporting ATPase